jgi:hypothetical protein
MAKVTCEFNRLGHPCPLKDVIEAGAPCGGGYWCNDFKQQAECGNEVNEQRGSRNLSQCGER